MNAPLSETTPQVGSAFAYSPLKLSSRTRLVEVYDFWRPNLPDEGDNHVLELAVAASDAPIVTFEPLSVARHTWSTRGGSGAAR